MKVFKVKCIIWKKKQTKTYFLRLQLLIFYKPAYLQDEHYRVAWSISINEDRKKISGEL